MSLLWGKDSQASGLSAESVRSASRERGEDGDARKAHGAGVEILHVSSPCNSPRVYSAWIDDFSDDLYLSAEPSYTPRSTFSERVAEIALGGFILLAVVCGLAAKFNW